MTKSALIGFNLQGRRALVTGSASGIGLATAGLLVRSGAHVAMNDLPTEALITAVSHFKAQGFRVDAVPGDLSMSASARDVALKTLELLGGLDYLVNNAGAPGTRTPIPPSDLNALTDDFWDRILRINLLSAFWMTKALAPALADAKGAVVNTVSVAALGGGGSSTAYATAKAGLAGLTRELAQRSRAGCTCQRDCTRFREFQLGVLVRRHRRCGKGEAVSSGARRANRRLCGSDCVPVCRRFVYYGRGYPGHGRNTDITAKQRGRPHNHDARFDKRLPTCLTLLAAGWSAAATASLGCGKTLASGIYQMTDQNVTRTYRVFVPSNYKPGISYPLVMVFHGWGGDENEFLSDSSVTTLADQRGYIVVAPRGTRVSRT